MSAKIKYKNESMGKVKVIADFLPLALSKKSVDFFKLEANKNNTQYQRMIRRLVDAYVETHSAS
jgi:hypothetical protein